MGRKRHDRPTHTPFDASGFERTMADAEAEADALDSGGTGQAVSDTTCLCGHREFVLEAFMHVVDGQIRPEPVEVESLTCPECGREYEAIPAEGGRILRGDFRGFADLED